jgi:hypothetical protein
MSERAWMPPEVIGLCPVCHDEFYVPHGGKCPGEHDDEAPDLIEYVRPGRLREALRELREAEREYAATRHPDDWHRLSTAQIKADQALAFGDTPDERKPLIDPTPVERSGDWDF